MISAFQSVDACFVMWFQFPIQTKVLTVVKCCMWPKQHFAIGADVDIELDLELGRAVCEAGKNLTAESRLRAVLKALLNAAWLPRSSPDKVWLLIKPYRDRSGAGFACLRSKTVYLEIIGKHRTRVTMLPPGGGAVGMISCENPA